MNRLLKKGKRFELDNLDYILKRYDFKNNSSLLLLIEELENHGGADLVVYNTTNMLEENITPEKFKEIINENGLDEEEYEVERVTLVKIDSL